MHIGSVCILTRLYLAQASLDEGSTFSCSLDNSVRPFYQPTTPARSRVQFHIQKQRCCLGLQGLSVVFPSYIQTDDLGPMLSCVHYTILAISIHMCSTLLGMHWTPAPSRFIVVSTAASERPYGSGGGQRAVGKFQVPQSTTWTKILARRRGAVPMIICRACSAYDSLSRNRPWPNAKRA